MKNVYNLVSDIYKLVESKEVAEGVDIESCIEQFGENVKDLMRKEFTEVRDDSRKLRMSNIGREERYLWNVYNDVDKGEDIQPHTYVKFLYGHLIEEMLLFLTRAAGHAVTDEQKLCEVNGVKGSMDCRIDGVVTDVKSTSTFGFKKFKEGTLAYDDPFGYIGQIKGYAHSEGETTFGWLAMDKQNGHLTYLLYDSEDTQAPVYDLISYDIGERIMQHFHQVLRVDRIWVIEIIRPHIFVLVRRERAIKRILRYQHHALLLQVLHDEITHRRLPTRRPTGDADQKRFAITAASTDAFIELGDVLAIRSPSRLASAAVVFEHLREILGRAPDLGRVFEVRG